MAVRLTSNIFMVLALVLLVAQVSAQSALFPELVQNKELVVKHGQPARIGSENLNANSLTTLVNQVAYTLVTAPKYGTIKLSGADLAEWDTFSQSDIEAGRVMYYPVQIMNGKDSFDFQLSHGPLIQRVSLHLDGSTLQNILPCANNLSNDGHFVLYETADNNEAMGDTNGKWDIFLRNLETGEVELITRSHDGGQSNGDSVNEGGFLSADGRYVAFDSSATNLVEQEAAVPGSYHVYRYDTLLQKIVKIDPVPYNPSLTNAFARGISQDGRIVLYSVDGIKVNEIYGSALYIYDFEKGTHELISHLPGFTSISGSISADGRFVITLSGELYDRLTKTMENIHMNNWVTPSLSADGRYIAFLGGDEIVPGDENGAADVFVYDRVLKTYEQLTFTSDQVPAVMNGITPSISADGRFVAFASTIRRGEVNTEQLILHNRINGNSEIISTSVDEQIGNSHSFCPSLSADGSRISFYSQATNLTNDGSIENGVFVRQFPKDVHTFSITFDNSWSFFLPLISQ